MIGNIFFDIIIDNIFDNAYHRLDSNLRSAKNVQGNGSRMALVTEMAKTPRARKNGGTPTEVIVRAMEEDIVLGRLHPRERLIEDDLCARFDVSRHALRQALAELERMGLIQRIPNRGAQVRKMSIEEIQQLYALRELLETTAAAQIPLPVAEDQLAELRTIQDRHDRAVNDEDLVGVFRSNHEFHRKLFSLCENVFLSDAIENYAQQAHGVRFMVLTNREDRAKARDEHHAILAALAEGDQARLVKLCRDHLPASIAAYLAFSAPHAS